MKKLILLSLIMGILSNLPSIVIYKNYSSDKNLKTLRFSMLNDSTATSHEFVKSYMDTINIHYNENKIIIPIQKQIIPALDSISTKEKILVMSDIEGNFEAFYQLLLSNKVIDKNGNWIFSKGQLVIVGDMVDRGDKVHECLYLLYKIDYQAYQAGGRVHYLIGNHDLMLMTGDDRYAHPKYKAMAKSLNQPVKDMYAQDTIIGSWMRSKKIILKINDKLFVHAGISLQLIQNNYTILEINQSFSDFLNHQIMNDRIQFLLRSYGPIWYRGMVMDYKSDLKISQSDFNTILNYFSVNRIFIGHTVVEQISSDYSGKLIRVDVDHYENAQALMITNKSIKVYNLKGEVQEIK